MLGQAHVAGQESGRLLQWGPAPAQPASCRPAPPSRPLSHQLCQTSRGIGKALREAGAGGPKDTLAFLLVTGSNFQCIFQALVMTEVFMPFLSTQEY